MKKLKNHKSVMGGGIWYKKSTIIIVILLFALSIGISFAYWKKTVNQNEKNIASTACFKITFESENDINLERTYPITDEEGKRLTPYSFTITNTCESFASFQINLEILNTTTFEDLSYMKVMFEEKIDSLTQKELTTKTLEDASKSYKLQTGYLKAKETKSYSLRLWMDENTPTDKKYMNKILESKITVVTTYIEKENEIIAEVSSKNNDYKETETLSIHVMSEKYDIISMSEDNETFEELESIGKDITIEKTYTENGTYHYYFKDELDNVKEVIVNATKIDNKKPIANMSVTRSNGVIRIDASGSLDEETRVKKYYYSKDGTNYEESTENTHEFIEYEYGVATTVLTNYEQNPIRKVYVKVEDEAGNISDIKEYNFSNINTGLLYDETVDNNLRYVGANPNNYVRFNNELWRVIGVMNNIDDGTGKKEKRIKLIRNESIGTYSWDNHDQYGRNDWINSPLMTILNSGAYWNRTTGSCPQGSYGATVSCNFTSIGLNTSAKNMIGNTLWNLGGSKSYKDVTASMFYTRERGTDVYSGRVSNWTGKIGLIYPSDYGYATSGSTSTNRKTCLSKALYEWNNVSECYNNDWLYKSSTDYWTLTPHADGPFDIFYVNNKGSALLESFRSNATHQFGVFPTLYLKPTIKITSGLGTSSSPFTLAID